MNENDDEQREEPIEGTDPAATPAPAEDPGPVGDAGLGDLKSRLGELQQRVELLGSQGIWPETPVPAPAPTQPDPYAAPPNPSAPQPEPYVPQPPDPYAQPQPAYNPYAPQQPSPYAPQQPYTPHTPPQPPAGPGNPYGQPPQPPVPQTGPYGAPDQPPASPMPGWEQTPQEAPPEAPPAPVATNGHSDDHAEISARSTSVALVDAGPFDDLIQLRHFEDELASLTAVRDVRVRRFGHGRASIEVGMTGPYSLGRELFRLGRQMSVTDGAAGDLVVDLAPTIAGTDELDDTEVVVDSETESGRP